MKNNETLEQRIRRIAASMDERGVKKFADAVPHSVFVEWDRTWDEGARDDISDDSTDKEIEKAILSQEGSHVEYYQDEIAKYLEQLAIPLVAGKLADTMAAQFPIEGEYMADEDVQRAKELAIGILSDDVKFGKATGFDGDLRIPFLLELIKDDGSSIEPTWEHVFCDVWFRERGKQVHKYLVTDVKKCLASAVLLWCF